MDPSEAKARGYACPGCGARVDEQSRRCSYCNAPVATVRCARCFHMNVPIAACCSGCGHELGLEPIPTGTYLSCPGCTEPLASFHAGSGNLLDCGKCGGQFVEHRLLRELLERRELLGHAAKHIAPPRVPVPTTVRYVKCPACGVHMNRKNFGGSSGVIVDVCSRHGVWFDAGELPRVLAFVESGGLARAQRRSAEEVTEQLRAMRLTPSRRPFEPNPRDRLTRAADADIASAAVDLLQLVVSLTDP